jgi:hypothetical protein
MSQGFNTYIPVHKKLSEVNSYIKGGHVVKQF